MINTTGVKDLVLSTTEALYACYKNLFTIPWKSPLHGPSCPVSLYRCWMSFFQPVFVDVRCAATTACVLWTTWLESGTKLNAFFFSSRPKFIYIQFFKYSNRQTASSVNHSFIDNLYRNINKWCFCINIPRSSCMKLWENTLQIKT